MYLGENMFKCTYHCLVDNLEPRVALHSSKSNLERLAMEDLKSCDREAGMYPGERSDAIREVEG